MNTKIELLSERQRQIMTIVWEQGEVSVFEVREILNQEGPVARNTVKTIMERLERKGWLKHRTVGRTFFYSATRSREDSVGRRVLEIIDKACFGKPENLMTALLNSRKLSAAELDRLDAILAEARAKKTRKKKKN